MSEEQGTSKQKDPAVKVGYWMAIFFPMVGVLVGNALISRGSDAGPRIVVWSVVSLIAWIVLIVAVDELAGGGLLN